MARFGKTGPHLARHRESCFAKSGHVAGARLLSSSETQPTKCCSSREPQLPAPPSSAFMTIDHRSASSSLQQLLATHTPAELLAKLAPKRTPLAPRVPSGGIDGESIAKRWAVLSGHESSERELFTEATASRASVYERNIENFIGTVNVPVGIAGPLRVNGTYAQGDFYVPLATTEAALVASYNRGALLISEAGGGSAILLREGVSRAPGFAFESVHGVGQFVAWAVGVFEQLRKVGRIHDSPRQAARHAREHRRESRLSDLRLHDRRGRWPEHGHDRYRGDLRLHRRARACEAELCVRRGQSLRRQEGEPAVVPQRSWTKRHVRVHRACRPRREAPAHDAADDGELLGHVRHGRCAERDDRRAGTLCERARGGVPGMWAGRGVRRGVRGWRHSLRGHQRRRSVRLGDAARISSSARSAEERRSRASGRASISSA